MSAMGDHQLASMEMMVGLSKELSYLADELNVEIHKFKIK